MDAKTFVRMDWLRPDTVSVPTWSWPGERGIDAFTETTRKATDTHRVESSSYGRSARLRRRNVRFEGSVPSLNGPPEASRTNGNRTPSTMNPPIRNFGFLRFIPERFHVLLYTFFKVLSTSLTVLVRYRFRSCI